MSVLQQILMINEGNVAIIAAENNLYGSYSSNNVVNDTYPIRGPQGARMIGDIAGKITCVDHLDLADNGFGDTGLATLIEARIYYHLHSYLIAQTVDVPCPLSFVALKSVLHL